MPNASNTDRVLRRHRRSGRHRHPGDHRRAGARPPGPCWRRSPPRRRPCPASGSGPSSGGDTPAWRPAPATPARTASRCAVPAEGAEAFWQATLGAGVRPAGLGARDTLRLEAACRCTATSWARASPRSRPGWAGSWPGTSRRLPGPRRAGGRAERGCGPAAAWACHRRAPAAPAGLPGPDRRPAGRRGHQRQLLARARPRHRPGPAAHRPSHPARRSRSTCGAGGAGARSCPLPFVAKQPAAKQTVTRQSAAKQKGA